MSYCTCSGSVWADCVVVECHRQRSSFFFFFVFFFGSCFTSSGFQQCTFPWSLFSSSWWNCPRCCSHNKIRSRDGRLSCDYVAQGELLQNGGTSSEIMTFLVVLVWTLKERREKEKKVEKEKEVEKAAGIDPAAAAPSHRCRVWWRSGKLRLCFGRGEMWRAGDWIK